MASRAAEAVPAALSSMSSMSTMTPFLYQTKTLASLTWIIANSSFRPRYVSRIRPSSFRCPLQQPSAKQRQYSTKTYTPLAPPDPHDEGKQANRVRRMRVGDTKIQNSKKKKTGKQSEFEIPFEFDRMSKGYKKGNGSLASRWETVKLNEFGEADDGDFQGSESAEHDEEDESLVTGHRGESMNLRGPRESTITDTERRAFQSIFSDIFAQSQLPAGQDEIFPPTTSRERAKSKLDTILNHALNSLPKSRAEKEEIVNRYPPALRSAAAKAMQLNESEQEEETEEQYGEQALVDHDQLEELRRPERERVEGWMKEAETDFELWAIMEKHVFSLIPKLGLEEVPVKDDKTRDTNKKAKGISKGLPSEEKKKNISRFEKIVAHSASGTEISALELYGPLYPSYLLLGLRLLDRSFAKPSPLALSILPKIKSLGAISHVLGASTQLYNEIIRIHFYRYEDFTAISATLNEMDRSAVEQDEETLEIITDILVMKALVARGEKGPVLKALWSMPQFSKINFHYWKNKIASNMAAKKEFKDGESIPTY